MNEQYIENEKYSKKQVKKVNKIHNRSQIENSYAEGTAFFMQDVYNRYFHKKEHLGPFCQLQGVDPTLDVKSDYNPGTFAYNYSFIGVTNSRAYFYQMHRSRYKLKRGNEANKFQSEFVSAKKFDWIRIQKRYDESIKKNYNAFALSLIMIFLGIFMSIAAMTSIFLLLVLFGFIIAIAQLVKNKKMISQKGLAFLRFRLGGKEYNFKIFNEFELRNVESFMKYGHSEFWQRDISRIPQSQPFLDNRETQKINSSFNVSKSIPNTYHEEEEKTTVIKTNTDYFEETKKQSQSLSQTGKPKIIHSKPKSKEKLEIGNKGIFKDVTIEKSKKQDFDLPQSSSSTETVKPKTIYSKPKSKERIEIEIENIKKLEKGIFKDVTIEKSKKQDFDLPQTVKMTEINTNSIDKEDNSWIEENENNEGWEENEDVWEHQTEKIEKCKNCLLEVLTTWEECPYCNQKLK